MSGVFLNELQEVQFAYYRHIFIKVIQGRNEEKRQNIKWMMKISYILHLQ